LATAPRTAASAKSINFEFYAPFSSSVSLVGDFNGWDETRDQLRKTSDGKWHTALKLNPGRYEYRFLVDGNWENDQSAHEYVPNTFGTWNCVIEVKS
jgi:1,4-alpha-glucan branching enzyme